MGMKTAMSQFRDTIEASQDEFITKDRLLAYIDTWGLEKEKQQIIDAVTFGDCRGKVQTYLTAEQYYSETFTKD